MTSYAAMGEAAYRINSRSNAGLTAWYQRYDRQIPPALFEPASVKEQVNSSLRLLGTWELHSKYGYWYARSSFINDKYDYRDGAIALKSQSTSYQYFQEAGWRSRSSNIGQFLIFVPLQLLLMDLPVTNETKQQHRLALAASYDYKHFDDRLDLAVNARAELIDNKNIFLPGISASFALTDWMTLRANVQRTYRTPTLNELYYAPGGNTQLLPEQGLAADAGYTLKAKYRRLLLYHDVSVFNRDIHDWIIWLGGAIWTPHNIAEVRSRGIETENKVTFTTGRWQLHAAVATAYVLATTTSSYIQNDGSINKQIPYTPRYNGRANIGLSYRKLELSYIHSYTGYRFTTSDESEFLLPYQTGNVQLMFPTQILGMPLQVTCQCNNIWNESYYIAGYRPMPGINWLVGLRLSVL